jgi:hypothetical protein
MSLLPQQSSHLGGYANPWLESAVFGLDRWLRRRQGVFEYTGNPSCMFRAQRAQADERVTLSDGTAIAPGDPILSLHLWNEHMPPLSADGATVSWARELCHRVEVSMLELARYLAECPELDDIKGVRGDMRLGTAEQSAQLARLAARYGFEPIAEAVRSSYLSSASLHRFSENIYIFLLVLATNPVAVGAPVLRRDHKLVYFSRSALTRRYGRDWENRERGARSAGVC